MKKTNQINKIISTGPVEPPVENVDVTIRMCEWLALCEALSSGEMNEPSRWFMQRAEGLLTNKFRRDMEKEKQSNALKLLIENAEQSVEYFESIGFKKNGKKSDQDIDHSGIEALKKAIAKVKGEVK